MAEAEAGVLFVEPFYGGSHKQLVDLLVCGFGGVLFTLPPTKWHWRMRVSALHFATDIPHSETYTTLFASSVLNLCELVSLRPDLARLHKLLYFHENQLVYPVRKHLERDFQYGYNQILSCLVADEILFNSSFNMNSFLQSIDPYLKLMPDFRPKGLAEQIRPKCKVLYYPLKLPVGTADERLSVGTADERLSVGTAEERLSVGTADEKLPVGTADERLSAIQERHEKANQDSNGCSVATNTPGSSSALTSCLLSQSDAAVAEANLCTPEATEPINSGPTSDSEHNTEGMENHAPLIVASSITSREPNPLHILWPHRWEHDKGPEEFCSVLLKLMEAGLDFCVSILGAHTNDIPTCFQTAIPQLGPRVVHQGHLPRQEYWETLHRADVVLSTAKHEFFGVAMLEAVFCGCYPLCPNRLVYPEFYPSECLYNTEQQLFMRLKRFCQHPHLARRESLHISEQMSIHQFLWENLKAEYASVLEANQAEPEHITSSN